MGLKKCSSASKGVPHLEAWVRVGFGIPHVKGHKSVLRLRYSKEYRVDDMLLDDFVMQLYQQSYNAELPFFLSHESP
jgi:hypothetical protein